MVFLHSFGGSSASWQRVCGLLRQRRPDCALLELDLRGHGQSPDGITHTVLDMARDVRETLDSLDVLQSMSLVVVGHAMGGKVALRLAAMQPPNLHGLILIAPSPPTPEPMTDRERRENLAAHASDEALRRALESIAGLPITPEDAAQFARDRTRTTDGAWKAWLTEGSRENIGALMNRVLLPTVILVGENDPVIPPAVQRRDTLGYVRNAFLFVVPGAGHLLPYEAPEVTADIIASSLPLFV